MAEQTVTRITVEVETTGFFDGWQELDAIDKAATLKAYHQCLWERIESAFPDADSIEIDLLPENQFGSRHPIFVEYADGESEFEANHTLGTGLEVATIEWLREQLWNDLDTWVVLIPDLELTNAEQLRSYSERGDLYYLLRIPNAATGEIEVARITPWTATPTTPGYWLCKWVVEGGYDHAHDSAANVTLLDPETWTRRRYYTTEWDVVADTAVWIEDGVLFLPADGQSMPPEVAARQQPASASGWYDPATGRQAVIGLPGSTLSRFV